MKNSKIVILIILYFGFISLGLPDQALGISWPWMRQVFNKPLDYAGILVTMTTLLSALSSFCSGYIMNRYKVSIILIASCLLTMSGIFGYAISPSFYILIICTIPLGLGGGAIDACLNNYVAENYSSRQMSWLHGCWGIGATLGPIIMTAAIAQQNNWRGGYLAMAAIQFVLLVGFISTTKLWKLQKKEIAINVETTIKLKSAESIVSVSLFFLYTAVEASIGLWFYSYMIESLKISPQIAGSGIVLYWGSLTAGRFIIGAFANKLGNRKIISYGMIGSIIGMGFLLSNNVFLITFGLCFTGFALAGIYPSMMHETPKRFGTKLGKTLTGYQAGLAALGVATLPPIIGVILANTSLSYLIPMLICIMTLMYFMGRFLNHRT